MNVSVIITLFTTFFLAMVSALPTLEDLHHKGFQIKVHDDDVEQTFSAKQFDDKQEEEVIRFRRATCDLLSFNTPFGSLNHSACAAHCLAMRKGYRGGRCKDGVCHCRK